MIADARTLTSIPADGFAALNGSFGVIASVGGHTT